MIVLHPRGRCIGVVRGDRLYTHNMWLSWPRAWTEITEEQVPVHLFGYLAAARRRAAEATP